MSRTRPSLWNWSAHTTIALCLTKSRVQDCFNLLLFSHRAWHSVEHSLFRESIHGKIKLVPSAPSPLASRHKADDYQLEAALLQRSTGALQPATKISTVCIWKLLTSHSLPILLRVSSRRSSFSTHQIQWHLMQYNTFGNTAYNYSLCIILSPGYRMFYWSRNSIVKITFFFEPSNPLCFLFLGFSVQKHIYSQRKAKDTTGQ